MRDDKGCHKAHFVGGVTNDMRRSPLSAAVVSRVTREAGELGSVKFAQLKRRRRTCVQSVALETKRHCRPRRYGRPAWFHRDFSLLSNSGSLAIFTAIRRASS